MEDFALESIKVTSAHAHRTIKMVMLVRKQLIQKRSSLDLVTRVRYALDKFSANLCDVVYVDK